MPYTIEVKDLGKKYLIGHQSKRVSTLKEKISHIFKKGTDRNIELEEFWALKNINFTVNKGEVIGIIGKNGAGKSTLLKILSGITIPTTGTVKMSGRPASLLEVGTGFHPELSGRENIYLNASILGMSMSEINKKFDKIVDFSGIEEFLDTPVKHYSSGMHVRLAFSVAAHLDPEILIVDEVLAVGDAEFQKKCIGKMEDATKKDGRTVIFVSHSMQAISRLTQRCLYLEKGQILHQGLTRDIIPLYLSHHDKGQIYTKSLSSERPLITRAEVITSDKMAVHRWGEPLEVRVELSTPYPIKESWLSIQILNSEGTAIFFTWISSKELNFCHEKGVFTLNCRLPKLRLFMGTYSIKLYFSEQQGGDFFDVVEGICSFEVTMFGKERDFEWLPNTATYLDDFLWTLKK